MPNDFVPAAATGLPASTPLIAALDAHRRRKQIAADAAWARETKRTIDRAFLMRRSHARARAARIANPGARYADLLSEAMRLEWQAARVSIADGAHLRRYFIAKEAAILAAEAAEAVAAPQPRAGIIGRLARAIRH